MQRWRILYGDPDTGGELPPPLEDALASGVPLQRPSSLAVRRAALFAALRRAVPNERVIQAMERVPRERFVPEAYRQFAYDDEALPIAEGQTISQPHIVAMMTAALDLRGTKKVLEIGTGSGYQAAVLSHLTARVVTVERIAGLAQHAQGLLAALGIANVEVHHTPAGLGWPQEAPYDAIIVTAGSPRVPQALLRQLAPGGRMVIPVGPHGGQDLLLIHNQDGNPITRNLGPCRFVPLIAPEAWSG